jgi:hypothetical protein
VLFGPFHEFFPIQASKNVCKQTINSKSSDAPPSGEYYFREMFCMDPQCDCRNAMISVQKKEGSGFKEMVKLRFCWENSDFYESIGLYFPAKLPGIFLDSNSCSKYDEFFIKIFEDICAKSNREEIIKQHYSEYKNFLRNRTLSSLDAQSVPRNSSCTCGSGKKYKHCCFLKKRKVASLLPLDLDKDWVRIRMAEGDIREVIMLHIEKSLPGIVLEAENIFTLNKKAAIDKDVYEVLFNFWLCFCWEMDNKCTIAQYFLQEHPQYFSSYEKRFIQSLEATCFTFYLVQNVIFERRLILKDIFTQNMIEVKECNGTKGIKKGSIIFGRHTTLDNQSILIGFAPVVIENGYFASLIHLRDSLCDQLSLQVFTPKLLKQYDFMLREFYFDLIEHSLIPPALVNTDEDPLELHEIMYELTCSVQEAFEELFVLCQSENAEKWLSQQEAEYDKKGNVIKVDVPWIKSDPLNPFARTIFANFTISPYKLKVFANSKKRSIAAKQAVKKLLGEKAIYKDTHISNLNQTQATPLPLPEKINRFPQSTIIFSAEIVTNLEDYKKNFWIKWPDQPLQTLDDLTPRQAAKTAKGREILNALFLSLEDQEIGKNPIPCTREDIDFLKLILGL